MSFSYDDLVRKRRNLSLPGYKSLADVGFDGPWITPYQKASSSTNGPVLIALHWLDEPSIDEYRTTLQNFGYLPSLRFNKVLDLALASRRLSRCDIYMTQAFHLIPQARSERIPPATIDISFDEITRHECRGRKVIALGNGAERACIRNNIQHIAVCHPSRRGFSNQANAIELSNAFAALGF